jgi:hypothetical protein
MFSGDVYQGVWNQTSVALKVFKAKTGIAPNPEVRHYTLNESMISKTIARLSVKKSVYVVSITFPLFEVLCSITDMV